MGFGYWHRELFDRMQGLPMMLPFSTGVVSVDGRVLLGLHQPDNQWGTIGGCIEPYESPEEALSREFLEETGARVNNHQLFGAYGGASFSGYLRGDTKVTGICIAYEVDLLDEPSKPDDEEIADLKWVELSEIAHLNLRPWVSEVLTDWMNLRKKGR